MIHTSKRYSLVVLNIAEPLNNIYIYLNVYGYSDYDYHRALKEDISIEKLSEVKREQTFIHISNKPFTIGESIKEDNEKEDLPKIWTTIENAYKTQYYQMMNWDVNGNDYDNDDNDSKGEYKEDEVYIRIADGFLNIIRISTKKGYPIHELCRYSVNLNDINYFETNGE